MYPSGGWNRACSTGCYFRDAYGWLIKCIQFNKCVMLTQILGFFRQRVRRIAVAAFELLRSEVISYDSYS